MKFVSAHRSCFVAYILADGDLGWTGADVAYSSLRTRCVCLAAIY